MPIFNPRLDVRPDTFGFSGAPLDKSFARSRSRRPFSDAEEVELALELLQVTSETEFDRFLGGLFKKAWGGIAPVGSKVIGPLQGLLKTVASKALPSVATAAATSFGSASDAVAGKLGSLVSRALEAEVTAPTGADRDLEKCRQLFEKHRQFVRLAGTAATAAAAAPTGVNPVAAAQRSLADSANERLMRKDASAGKTARFTAGAPAAATMTTAAPAGRAAKQRSQTKTTAPGVHTCSVCEQPPGSCQCRKVGRSGGWFRRGSSIIVNC